MSARPKLVTSSLRQVRSPERQALAAAIEGLGELTRRRAAIETAIETARQEVRAADRALEKAKDAIETAKKAVPKHLVAVALGESGPAPKSVKAARAAAQDAEDALEAAEEALRALTAQLKDAQSSEFYAAGRVKDAISAVCRADPAVHNLVNEYTATLRRVVDLRRALDFLWSVQALSSEQDLARGVPASLVTLRAPDHKWEDCRGDQPWRAALKVLERDADAELPSS